MSKMLMRVCCVFFLSAVFSLAFAFSSCDVFRDRGVELSYCVEGSGLPVVFISGQGNDQTSWPAIFLKKVSACARVVTFDRPGYGQSTDKKMPKALTAAYNARMLHKLLAHLSIKQVVLVGHSLGGLYAQHYARRYPKQVMGVVLLDSSGFDADEPKIFSGPKPSVGSMAYREYLGYAASKKQVREGNLFPSIPLLLMVAEHGESKPAVVSSWYRVQEHIAKQSPLSVIRVIRKAGHDIFLDAPDEVAGAVCKMVNKVSPL